MKLHTEKTASYLNPAPLAHWEKEREAPRIGSQFPPLECVTRPTVPTADAAYYLARRPQTMRGWASAESFPEGLRPLRVNGRLAWPVAGIKSLLGVA